MELKVTMQLNPKQTIEATFEGENIQEAVLAAGCLLAFDGVCGFCKSEDIVLQTRITKEAGYKYTEFVCKACGAKRQMGAYQHDKGFFLKIWEEPYDPNKPKKIE
jgi:hypothetical protein